MLFTVAHILELDGHRGLGNIQFECQKLAAKAFPEIPWEWWLPKILEEPTSKCLLLDAIRFMSFLCFVEGIVALTWNRSRTSLISRYYVHCTYA